MRATGRTACLAVLWAALLCLAVPQGASARALGFSPTPSDTEPYLACGRPTPQHAECLAIIVPSSSTPSLSRSQLAPALVAPALSGSGVGGGFAPADLRSAYDLPSESSGSGQTVAIVDAFDDPNAESDLAVYRSRYGLSSCTTANGCFRKANQTGGTSYPEANAGWAAEISLDLDMVSAACPNCHILLVEATSNANSNLYTAEDEAATLGATEISNSWGGEESSGETSDDSFFDHPGVPVTASAGDSGFEVEYPAASPDVIAVGGTALTPASNSRGWSETAWSGTGSGCSVYERKPAWQTDEGCADRTVNDVSAVASPETPLSIADSYKLPPKFPVPEKGWTLVGGTSASSPLIAGTMALANAHTRSFAGADALYVEAAQNGTGVLDDVTSGSNGSCGNYLCNARAGYDGPTGLGSPFGAPRVLIAPTVKTEKATEVAQTTATLNATVNPNGASVSECELEYGTTLSYGKTAPCAPSPGSGESPVAVTAHVSTLTASSTYHFRVAAKNGGGTGDGADETFKTLAGCGAEGFCQSFTHYETPHGAFTTPNALALDSSSDLWVADSAADQLIKLNPEHTKALAQLGSEGTGSGQFKGISAIATNSAGDLYAADSGNNRIQEFGPGGEFIRSFGSSALKGGQLLAPSAIAIDASGDVWVLNAAGASGDRIVEFSSEGAELSKFGTNGSGEGQLSTAYGLAISGGNLYVAEAANSRVQEFSTAGAFITRFDEEGSGDARSNAPDAIATEASTGDLYVSETGNNRVQVFSPAGAFITTFASPGSGAGQLANPGGLAIATSGTVFVSDTANRRVQEWSKGSPPTYVQSFTHYESPHAGFTGPNALALDSSSDLWVADSAADQLIKLNPEHTKALVQLGSEGSGSGQFKGIAAIATNSAGDLYAADSGNNRIQEFGPGGEFIRSFGSSALKGGQLLAPSAIAIDASGDVWVLNASSIVEFSSEGAELSKFGTNGSGEGQLSTAYGLAISGGNLYVAEAANSRVQEFSTAGVFIAKFDEAGSGTGQSNKPNAIATEASTGDLYVSETGNDRVQVFSPAGAFITTFASPGSGAGQLANPGGLAIATSGTVFLADTANRRLEEWLLP